MQPPLGDRMNKLAHDGSTYDNPPLAKSSQNTEPSADAVLFQAPPPDKSFTVASVNWKGHFKRLRLEPGPRYINLPLSACVGEGDVVSVQEAAVSVVCKHGAALLLPSYVERQTLHLGDL